MAVDFPTSPTLGQVVHGSGVTWRWDGTVWVLSGGVPSSKGTIAYTQIVADQTGITSTVDIAGLSVSFAAQAGRRYKITLHAYTASTVAADALNLKILNGSTQVASSQVVAASVPGYSLKQTCMAVIQVSTSATLTIKAQAQRTAGTGNMLVVANSGDPAFLMVEDVTYEGPSGGEAAGLLVQTRAWKSSNQAIAASTVTAVTFDQEAADPFGFHAPAEPQKFYAPVSGIYLCIASLVWNGTSGGAREGWFAIGGNTSHRIGLVDVLDVNSNQAFNVTALVPLTIGQWIETHVYQNSGASQNVGGANGASAQYGGGVSSFYMALLGSGT